jgi:hypothetical protein
MPNSNSIFRLKAGFIKSLHERCMNEGRLVRNALDKEDLELVGFYEPSQSEVAKFITVAFWGSLITEEGRNHDFTIALVPPPFDVGRSFIFGDPRPFEPEEIAKLAPALKPSDTIGVRVQNKKLVIWGYMESVGFGLSIRTLGPGQILVSFANEQTNRVFITGSRANFVDSSRLNLSSTLLRKLSPDPIQATDIETFKTAFFRSYDLENIAKAMRAHRHGGTMLLVYPGSEWQTSISQPYHYGGQPFNKTKNDLERVDRARGTLKSKELLFPSGEYKDALEIAEKSLESIGQLTAIDGATVVDYDLAVLAFGVKIMPINSQNKPERVRVVEPFEGGQKQEVSISDIGGTRHQSACQFVFDQREAMAIVASQDGRLSVFTWDSLREIVTILRHAEVLS